MASGSITSWQIDREKVERVTNFFFLASKITADGDCSHEIKRCLLFERKSMTNLDNIFKNRHHFAKICIVKATIFPVVMYGWKVGPYRRLSTKELMPSNCGAGEDLKFLWTARPNQSILKERNLNIY